MNSNQKLQGQSNLIPEKYEDEQALTAKLQLYESQLKSKIVAHFSLLNGSKAKNFVDTPIKLISC